MIAGLILIAPFFLYILAGVLAQVLLRHDAVQQRWLDAFIYYVALPALLFQSVRMVPPKDPRVVGALSLGHSNTCSFFM